MSGADLHNDRTRWIALYVLCAGMLMIVLDATIVNVALPSIQDDLGFSQSNLAWVVNAYLIAVRRPAAARRPARRPDRPAADLPDRPRRLHRAPRCCARSPQSQAMLIGARFVQGVGGAMTSAVILGMIVTMFPEPREQAKAIGVYGFVASAGASIGLLAGGVLTQAINWHWIFFVNLPIGDRDRVLRAAAGRAPRGDRPRARAPTSPARSLITGGADARRLHDPRHRRARLGLDPDARARRRLARAAGGASSRARRASPTR